MSKHQTVEGKLKYHEYDGHTYSIDSGRDTWSIADVIDEYEGKRIRVTVMVQDLDAEPDLDAFGEVSDGIHTFNELYEYRCLYNAGLFNSWAFYNYTGPVEDVHKAKLHADGTHPFGDTNLFVVRAQLPTGQISNHYEMQHWDLFQIPERDRSVEWDGHTAAEAAARLRRFLTWDY